MFRTWSTLVVAMAAAVAIALLAWPGFNLPAVRPVGTMAITSGEGDLALRPTPGVDDPTRPVETVIAWSQTQSAFQAIYSLTPEPASTAWPAGVYGTEGDPLAASWSNQGLKVTSIVVGYLPDDKQYVVNVFVTAGETGSGVIVQRQYGNGGTGGIVRTAEYHPDLRGVMDHNGRIELVSSDGRTLYFDVLGMAFVNSLEEPVPVWTPGSPIPGSLGAGYPAPPIEATPAVAP